MISDFQIALNNFNSGVYDYTDNGTCSQCGECCSNLLPMTTKEIKEIRRYIKKHHIKEQRHFLPTAAPMIDATCPFLMNGRKTEKCAIYPVRPMICRCFICSEPKGALKHKELYAARRELVDMRKEFFGENKK